MDNRIDSTTAVMGGDDFFDQFGGSTTPPQQQGAAAVAAPTTGATPPQQQGAQGDAAFDLFGQQWLASGGRTTADLQNFVTQWNAQNPQAVVTLGGSKGDKVYGPGGQFWNDAVIAAGEGGRGGSWGPRAGASGSSGINMGNFGSLAQGWDQQFKSPTIDEMRAMPGYQFALNEGIGALDKTAAARGTVLSGGQKKNVLDYAIGLADQTGQQKYQNALGEYTQAYNIFRNNNNDVFDRFDRLSQRGTTAAGSATA